MDYEVKNSIYCILMGISVRGGFQNISQVLDLRLPAVNSCNAVLLSACCRAKAAGQRVHLHGSVNGGVLSSAGDLLQQ